MATVVTRFEVHLPYVNSETEVTAYNAIQTFINDMVTLTNDARGNNCYIYQTFDAAGQKNSPRTLYGYLTSAQTSTALARLATLNANIGVPYSPVVTVSWQAAAQP